MKIITAVLILLALALLTGCSALPQRRTAQEEIEQRRDIERSVEALRPPRNLMR